MQTLDNLNVLNRLAALQRLCSDHDSNFPRALLFVVGQDGRNNKGSVSVLKYLFRGAVAKDLFDDTLDAELQDLEELVILVKQTSISVIWSHAMRKLLYPSFVGFPMLVEYLSTPEEEAEMDSAQARKCCDFKRMLLEALRDGDGVGMPVPIAYDDVTEVESWPLLQAFAMDNVYCPTGFFTAKYNVADITEHLETLFRVVDGFFVDNAIKMVSQTIKPHVQQSLSILNHQTSDQRAGTTADDVIGPLDVLFEFGAMDAAVPVDPTFRPVVLFGAHTTDLGAATLSTQPWGRRTVSLATHAVYEACEPSTGMRWCRTYFLQRGRALPMLADAESLVDDYDVVGDSKSRGAGAAGGVSDSAEAAGTADDDNSDESDAEADDGHFQWPGGSYRKHHRRRQPHGSAAQRNTDFLTGPVPAAAFTTFPAFAAVQRMELLYTKLRLGLRQVTKECFSSQVDVLEAGTAVQREMDLLMKGLRRVTGSGSNAGGSGSPHYLDQVVLSGTERLLVHMDCMNALGQLVTIEDVDDLGGSCWTYIRVSVYGVAVPASAAGAGGDAKASAGSTEYVSVAVGDTFLFSSLSTRPPAAAAAGCPSVVQQVSVPPRSAWRDMDLSLSLSPLLSDSFCVTHVLPYYHSALAVGAEDKAAKLMLDGTRSIHILSRLGLGAPLVSTGSGVLSLSLLSDHPSVPVLETSAVRVFSSGLLVERTGVSCVPVLISIPTHVDCMWTVDSSELLEQVAHTLLPYLKTQSEDQQQGQQQGLDWLHSRFTCPPGKLVVFRIKDFDSPAYATASADSGGVGVGGAEGKEESIIEHPRSQFALNTLALALPAGMQTSLSGGGLGAARHLAIFVRASSRAAGAMTAALASWRQALRLYSVPEHRGLRGAEPLPSAILGAFMCGVDSWRNEEKAATFPQLFGAASPAAAAPSSALGENHTGEEEQTDGESDSLSPAVAVAVSEFAKLNPLLPAPGSAGFDALRSLHSVSEARRLAHTDHLTPLLAESATTTAAATTASRTCASANVQVVVVAGQSGSGATVVGSLLALQLADKLGNSGSGAAVRYVCLDFTELSAKLSAERCDNAADAQLLLADFLAAHGATLSAHCVDGACRLVVVSLVQCAASHVCFADTLAWLNATSGGAVACVVSVVVPSALTAFNSNISSSSGSSNASAYSSAPYASTRYGLGQEVHLAAALELLHAPHCDVAVAVEEVSSSPAYSAFRRYMELRNPAAALVRQTPLNMRLDTDSLDAVVCKLRICTLSPPASSSSAVAAAAAAAIAKRSAALFARGWSPSAGAVQCHLSSAHLGGRISAKSSAVQRTNRSVRVRGGTASGAVWNAQSVLRVLQLLFPSARVASVPVEDVWQRPAPRLAVGESMLQRAQRIATIKVMSQRRAKEGRAKFEAQLDELLRRDGLGDKRLASLVQGMQGVRGRLVLQAGIPLEKQQTDVTVRGLRPVVVEACKAFCIVRNDEHAESSSSSTNELVFCGVLDSADEALLCELVSMCAQHQLQRRPAATAADISDSLKTRIQNMPIYSDARPLPGNVWFDGSAYVDIHGSRMQHRPDIADLVDLYLRDENRRVEKYNELVAYLDE